MAEGTAEAAMSSSVHLERMIGDAIASWPLTPAVQAILDNRDTSAGFAIQADDTAVRIVLSEVLDPAKVLEIQQQVAKRKMVPCY